MIVTAASIVFRYLPSTTQLVETLVKVDGDSPFQKQCVAIKKTKGVAAFEELVLGTKLSTTFKLVGEPAKTLRESLRTDKASNWRKDIFGTLTTLPQMLVRTTPAYRNTFATASLDPEFVTSIKIFVGDRDITDETEEIAAIAKQLGYCESLLEDVHLVMKFIDQHLSHFDRQKLENMMEKELGRPVKLVSALDGCVEATLLVPRYIADAFLEESDFSRIEAQFGKLVAWIDLPIPTNPTSSGFEEALAANSSTLLERFVVLRSYFRAVAAQNAHILFKDILDERCLTRACVILKSILRSRVLRDRARELTKVTLHPNECDRLWHFSNGTLELYSGNSVIGENRFAYEVFGCSSETDNETIKVKGTLSYITTYAPSNDSLVTMLRSHLSGLTPDVSPDSVNWELRRLPSQLKSLEQLHNGSILEAEPVPPPYLVVGTQFDHCDLVETWEIPSTLQVHSRYPADTVIVTCNHRDRVDAGEWEPRRLPSRLKTSEQLHNGSLPEAEPVPPPYLVVGTQFDHCDLVETWEVPYPLQVHSCYPADTVFVTCDHCDCVDAGEWEPVRLPSRLLKSVKVFKSITQVGSLGILLERVALEGDSISPVTYQGTCVNHVGAALFVSFPSVSFVAVPPKIAILEWKNVGYETLPLMKVSNQRNKQLETIWNLEMINRVPLLSRNGKLISSNLRQCQNWSEYLNAIGFFVDRLSNGQWCIDHSIYWEK